MWLPFPIWIIVALIAFFSISPTAPSSHAKRAAASMLILWPVWLILFIVVMSLIGTTPTDLPVGRGWGVPHNSAALEVTTAVMLLAWVLIMVLFLVFADLMFLSTHVYTNSIFDLRRLRSIHLGFNISSLLVFPPLGVIGIPLTLIGLSRHRTKDRRMFGWSALCGSTALISLIIATLVIAIGASVTVTETVDVTCYSFETTTPFDNGFSTTTIPVFDTTLTTSILTTAAATTVSSTTVDAATASATTTTDSVSGSSSNGSGSSSSGTSTDNLQTMLPTTSTTGVAASIVVWDPTTSSTTAFETTPPTYCGPGVTEEWRSSLLQASTDATAAAAVFSCLFALCQMFFLMFADVMMLRQLDGGGSTVGSNVVVSQAPGATSTTLVHPCPSCSTPLQFTRTGPKTMVQCFSCSATVEFATTV
jgi:hypothetical protein